MGDAIVVLITAGSDEEAVKIANALVEEHLVACVNIVSGVQSVFFWQAKIQKARESLLICKSRLPMMDTIMKRVKSLHSYTVPEIIALPVVGGSQDYLDWIRDSTAQ